MNETAATPERSASVAAGDIRRYDRIVSWVVVLVPLLGAAAAVSLVAGGWQVTWVEATLGVGMYLFTMMGIEIGYHRCFAHRAFRPRPWLAQVLAVAGSLAGHGPLIWWVATHRRHHRWVDTQDDPHTPNHVLPGRFASLRAFAYGYVGWTFDTEVKVRDGWQRYAQDLYREPALFRIHYRFVWIALVGTLLPAVAGGLMHGSWPGVLAGLLFGSLLPICVTQHLFWMINSFGHRMGAKPNQSRLTGESRNCWWLAPWTFGQGWHNNHHAAPALATTRMQWWQVDPGAWIIRGFELLGWAHDIKWRLEGPAEPLRYDNLVQCLLHREASCDGGVGFRFVTATGHEEVSYASLIGGARRVAAALQGRGLQRERVIVMCELGRDYVESFLGCVLAGAIAVPCIPTPGTHHRLKLLQIIRDCRPRLIVCASGSKTLLRRLIDDHGLANEAIEIVAPHELDGSGAPWTPQPAAPGDVVLLQYTSGSTGTPKGVKVSHANLLANLGAIQRKFGLSPASRGLVWLPPYHDMGLIGGLLTPLYVGYQNTLMSPMVFAQKPARWLQCISRYRITVTGGPSFGYRLCVERVDEADCVGLDLSSWEVAYNGAERVCPDTLSLFTRKFAPCGFDPLAHFPTYGLAEATLLVTAGGKRSPYKTLDADLDGVARRVVSCGAVADCCELLVVDPKRCAPVAEGAVGEIWLRGPSIACGYWNEHSDDAFHGTLAGGTVTYLRTGDLGLMAHGELYVLGRRKELIIVCGTNHYPGDIEQAAARARGAFNPAGVVAFAVDGRDKEEVVLMVETLRHTPTHAHGDIKAGIRAAVARDCGLAIDDIVLVRPGALERTSSGKLMRTRMKELYVQQRASPRSSQRALVPVT
jgi:acyl-CoA synthetase (AMP-forming)/AMP-acid ligase II/fatty-acid desaturase